MRKYEMSEAEFLESYMDEEDCLQLQDEREYQDYMDMMSYYDELEELAYLCERYGY